MARFDDGGGGSQSIGSGLGNAIGSISNSVKKAAKKSYTPKRRSGGGGGGSHRRSSGGGGGNRNNYSRQPTYNPPQVSRPAVGSTSKGTVAPSVPAPAPAPPPMTLDQWLAKDTAYLSQKNSYDKALKDYAAQDAAERNKYNTEYNSSLGKLNVEKGDAQTALNDDYAARGLMTSGLYADALNDFQNNYTTRQGDLERARQAYLGDLTTDKTNFTTQQQLELQRAKDAAAARRTTQLGL